MNFRSIVFINCHEILCHAALEVLWVHYLKLRDLASKPGLIGMFYPLKSFCILMTRSTFPKPYSPVFFFFVETMIFSETGMNPV